MGEIFVGGIFVGGIFVGGIFVGGIFLEPLPQLLERVSETFCQEEQLTKESKRTKGQGTC